jgi:hypothetical protein
MKNFGDLYNRVVLEMARTPRLAQETLDPDDNNRLQHLSGELRDRLKYGVHKYPELVDSKGEEAYGIDNSILRERLLRYIYLHLTPYIRHVDPNNPDSLRDALSKANTEMIEYLKGLGEWEQTPTLQRITKGILNKIKKNPKWFNSTFFEELLLKPTSLANYMNFARVNPHKNAMRSVERREQAYGMDVRDVDKLKASMRDHITKTNRSNQYIKRRESENPEP